MAKERFLNLEFEIEGEKQLARSFDFIAEELEDFTTPLKSSSNILLKTWDVNFDRNGNEIGEPWKSLNPAYASWKAIKYPGKGILQRTGRMRRGFEKHMTKVQSTLFNPTPYFKYHQSNKPRNSNLPRRVMMKIDLQRGKEIVGEFTKFLNDVANRWEKF